MPYVEYDEIEATCSDCGRLFRSEEALEAHVAEVHRPVEQARLRHASATTASSGSRCPDCEVSLSSPSELRRHRSTAHSKSEPQTAAL
jgi:uncharacterized C2H2 Zn-finger protein